MANGLNRFLGGSPLAVLGKLILLSILIGVVLSALGLDPWNIVESVRRLHPQHLGHGLRCGALALAVFPARRRARDPDLADPAADQRAEGTVDQAGHGSAVIAAASTPTRSASFAGLAAIERARAARP